jgi:hypothetical protein
MVRRHNSFLNGYIFGLQMASFKVDSIESFAWVCHISSMHCFHLNQIGHVSYCALWINALIGKLFCNQAKFELIRISVLLVTSWKRITSNGRLSDVDAIILLLIASI